MTCSIIIRAFNEEKHLGRLLKGIGHQTELKAMEVIVVDSGSKDETINIALKSGAKVIQISPDAFSFGRALNRGCEAASGDILVFASAHVYPVFTDWISNMLQHFEDDKVALVYGRQIGNEKTKFSEKQVFKKWFPGQSNYNQQTPFCNNANCAIRKALWKEHAFNESLTGLEDLDWANHIMSNGKRIVYEAEAPIVHVHEESAAQIKNRYQREAIAFKKIMPHVHFSAWDFLRLFIGSFLYDSLHAIRQGIWWKERKSILVFRLMQYYGTYLGHNQSGEVTQELKMRFYYPFSRKMEAKVTVKQLRDTHKIEYN